MSISRRGCWTGRGRIATDSEHVNGLDTLAPASFDLIHSYLVFQHIAVSRGELILRKLISLIAKGGMGTIHLT